MGDAATKVFAGDAGRAQLEILGFLDGQPGAYDLATTFNNLPVVVGIDSPLTNGNGTFSVTVVYVVI